MLCPSVSNMTSTNKVWLRENTWDGKERYDIKWRPTRAPPSHVLSISPNRGCVISHPWLTHTHTHTHTRTKIKVVMIFCASKVTWLANEECNIIPKDGWTSIQEVRGQLHHHWQLSQLFYQLTCLKWSLHIHNRKCLRRYIHVHIRRYSRFAATGYHPI